MEPLILFLAIGLLSLFLVGIILVARIANLEREMIVTREILQWRTERNGKQESE